MKSTRLLLLLCMLATPAFGQSDDVAIFRSQLEAYASAGHSGAQWQLGESYIYNAPTNVRLGIEWLERSSDQGDPTAKLRLGRIYFDGIDGVPPNPELGLSYIRSSANLGNREAQWQMGEVYRLGLGGVEMSALSARQWFELSARGKYPRGMYGLGRFFYSGEGGEQSDAKALALFLAAANEHPPSAYYAGMILVEGGPGVPKDVASGVKLLELAMSGRSVDAATYLGVLYATGEGVDKDFDRAVHYFEYGAQNDDDLAQRNLVRAYLNGDGEGKRDLVKALTWQLFRARRNPEAAAGDIADIEVMMTREEIERAKSAFAAMQGTVSPGSR